LRSFDDVRAFKNYPTRGKERFIAFRRLTRAFMDAESPNGHVFRPIMLLQSDRINQITHAATAYKSQFAGLFGTVEVFLKENLSYALRLGARSYAERYWAGSSE